MERAIAEMEKIKKAEEIYSRRKNLENEEKKPKNIYKFLFEVLLLINIVILIVAIQNQNYIFTKDFIKQVNSYNVNIKNKLDGAFTSSSKKEEKKSDSKTEEIKNEETDAVSGEANNANSAILVDNEPQPEEASSKPIEELSQEDKDVFEIKNNYSVILPVSGVKTSGFGYRESTNPIVNSNHTGVDIAANLGTVIKSATTGTVTQVSDVGNYGNHLRIQTGDLVVLYAHCSKIYVKEGQEINQGDQIAEVGSTGHSTGPHLHFELIIHDRRVDPEKIISI